MLVSTTYNSYYYFLNLIFLLYFWVLLSLIKNLFLLDIFLLNIFSKLFILHIQPTKMWILYYITIRFRQMQLQMFYFIGHKKNFWDFIFSGFHVIFWALCIWTSFSKLDSYFFKPYALKFHVFKPYLNIFELCSHVFELHFSALCYHIFKLHTFKSRVFELFFGLSFFRPHFINFLYFFNFNPTLLDLYL